jgi:hypothetical protein
MTSYWYWVSLRVRMLWLQVLDKYFIRFSTTRCSIDDNIPSLLRSTRFDSRPGVEYRVTVPWFTSVALGKYRHSTHTSKLATAVTSRIFSNSSLIKIYHLSSLDATSSAFDTRSIQYSFLIMPHVAMYFHTPSSFYSELIIFKLTNLCVFLYSFVHITNYCMVIAL